MAPLGERRPGHHALAMWVADTTDLARLAEAEGTLPALPVAWNGPLAPNAEGEDYMQLQWVLHRGPRAPLMLLDAVAGADPAAAAGADPAAAAGADPAAAAGEDQDAAAAQAAERRRSASRRRQDRVRRDVGVAGRTPNEPAVLREAVPPAGAWAAAAAQPAGPPKAPAAVPAPVLPAGVPGGPRHWGGLQPAVQHQPAGPEAPVQHAPKAPGPMAPAPPAGPVARNVWNRGPVPPGTAMQLRNQGWVVPQHLVVMLPAAAWDAGAAPQVAQQQQLACLQPAQQQHAAQPAQQQQPAQPAQQQQPEPEPAQEQQQLIQRGAAFGLPVHGAAAPVVQPAPAEGLMAPAAAAAAPAAAAAAAAGPAAAAAAAVPAGNLPGRPVQAPWVQPRGVGCRGARQRVCIITGENTTEGRFLITQLEAGPDHLHYVDCSMLGAQPPNPIERACPGDGHGYSMWTVASHVSLELVLARFLDEFVEADRGCQHPGDFPKVVVVDTHGKHRSPALAALLATVLEARGWAVRVRHTATNYKAAARRCQCATAPEGGYCGLVEDTRRRQQGGRVSPRQTYAREIHVAQRDMRQRALRRFAERAEPLFRERGLPW